jgi:hypothetical protein
MSLRKELEELAFVQILVFVATIGGLWMNIFGPKATDVCCCCFSFYARYVCSLLLYVVLAIVELGGIVFLSGFVDEGYTEDDGVIAIWKDCGTNGSIGYGLFVFFCFEIFAVIFFLCVCVYFSCKALHTGNFLSLSSSRPKKSDDYGVGASASFV